MTEEWTLRWTIARSPRWASAMQIAWLPPEAPLTRNQLRLAPQASAASCLRLLERDVERVGPMSMPSIAGREVEAQRGVADRLRAGRVGAGAALVAGDVESARVGRREANSASRIRSLV